MPDEPPWKPTLARTLSKDDDTALNLGDLEALFRERPVRCVNKTSNILDKLPKGSQPKAKAALHEIFSSQRSPRCGCGR